MGIDFETWWTAVPRKVGKDAAKKSYISARRTADAGTLLAGIRRYASERAGQDPRYTKHPATWLNGGCWADDPEPPRLNGLHASGGSRASILRELLSELDCRVGPSSTAGHMSGRSVKRAPERQASQTLASVAPLALEHAEALQRRNSLLPAALVEAIRSEIETGLAATCDRRTASMLAGRLLFAFPSRSTKSVADVRAFAAILVEKLGELPPFAATAAVEYAIETSKWLPAISVVMIAAQDEILQLHQLKLAADRMAAVHRARAAATARAAADDERERKFWHERDRIAVAHFDAAPGDFEATTAALDCLTGRPWPCTLWLRLTKPGAAWPPAVREVIAVGSPIGRAVWAWRVGSAETSDVIAVAELGREGNLAEARSLVAKIEARIVPAVAPTLWVGATEQLGGNFAWLANLLPPGEADGRPMEVIAA